MAILEKEVWVSLSSANIDYYETKGYDIPRVKVDSCLRVKRGTKLLVKIEDLSDGSNVYVTKVCDVDSCQRQIPNQKFQTIINARKKANGIDMCQECAYTKISESKLKNVKYESSLEYYAINNKEYLLDEFSHNNIKKPSEISFGSEYHYLWDCPKCKNEYELAVGRRTSFGESCPYCAGKRIKIGLNDLWTTHGDVASMLIDQQRGYEISFGSGKKEDFKCKNCNHIIKNKTVSEVVKKGLSCPRCSDGISYPEKLMFSVLNQLGVYFETQKRFDWSLDKRYDFYIPSLNCIIETHGQQHYEKAFHVFGGRTLQEEKDNDELKQNLAFDNSIKYYIVINCSISNIKFIRDNILNSELNIILNLENIDWLSCNEYAFNSLIKAVSDLWNSNQRNTQKIADILKIARATVIRFLKQAALLGWCDYDPKESLRENGKSGGSPKRRIIQLSLDGEFIKEWESISEATEELNILRSGIISTCRGRNSKSGGFRWMYKSDYDKLIESKEVVL